MKTVLLLFHSLRPTQWTKNGFIMLPLLFAQKLFHYPSLLKALVAVAIFCILASAVYIINDISDLEADRRHPEKKHRPLASGSVSPGLAKLVAGILLFLSLSWGYYLGNGFVLILICYLVVQLLYNFRLKEVMILDVFCVSAGFFLRVIAGAVAIHVAISHWLIICTILLAMFIALGRRRHEMMLLGSTEAGRHRKVLSEYNPYLLDQMVGVITASTLLSYMLYCISLETIEKFKTDHLIYTFPFVLYGIFRYLYLIHKKNQGGSPEKILVTDFPLLLSIILWGLSCILILYGVI